MLVLQPHYASPLMQSGPSETGPLAETMHMAHRLLSTLKCSLQRRLQATTL